MQERTTNAHVVYKEIMRKFLEGAVGHIHEIFIICCNYGTMGIWQAKCPMKINPLARIKRIVEAHQQLQIDLGILRRSNCACSALRIFTEKKYTLEQWLNGMGRVASTRHRQVFFYTMLDVAYYDRHFGNCGTTVKDIRATICKNAPRWSTKGKSL